MYPICDKNLFLLMFGFGPAQLRMALVQLMADRDQSGDPAQFPEKKHISPLISLIQLPTAD